MKIDCSCLVCTAYMLGGASVLNAPATAWPPGVLNAPTTAGKAGRATVILHAAGELTPTEARTVARELLRADFQERTPDTYLDNEIPRRR